MGKGPKSMMSSRSLRNIEVIIVANRFRSYLESEQRIKWRSR